MTDGQENARGIYALSKLLANTKIEQSAWIQNGRKQLLAVYTTKGDFIYYYITDEEPIIKQIPWFSSPTHTPISITFNPSGTFLLVLSQSCHVYLVPALSIIDSNVKSDHIFDTNDITIHTYPFLSKQNKPAKSKLKSPSSSLSVKSSLSRQSSSSSSSSSSNENQRQRSLSSSSTNDKITDNVNKLRDFVGSKTEVAPSVVTWWQCVQDCQHVAVIGTKSGDIYFVDLNSGLKIGSSNVKGKIKGLSVCQDNTLDTIFLLITVESNDQYKLVLEQRHANYIWPGKQAAPEDSESIEGMNLVGSGKGNYLPSARARLQGLKQLSVEKLATLKQKIAETRSKARQGVIEDSSPKLFGAPVPENLSSTVGDTIMSLQFSRERHVLAGYYAPSQLLTVHTMALDIVPLFIHKMPSDTDEILLCDRVIYTVSRTRTVLQVISNHLSEARIEPSSDFNTDSILGKWDFVELSNDESSAEVSEEISAKPDLIPEELPVGKGERIIAIYKSHGKSEPFNISEEFQIEKSKEELPETPKVENCLVVTTRGVYILELRANIVKTALNLILKTQELEKAERICKIFGINLQKLLELAGDIKLAGLEFPKAIALYKLSKCGLLKSIVKLSCGGHCSEVLSYSTMMVANSMTDMTLTERIHLSNLVLMAYTQQILKREVNQALMDKFLDFIEKNTYYDEILAVSVTGQSLLFSCLHRLITYKGLILDGYNVLIKLMQRFLKNKSLQWTINKVHFWNCVTDANLIEAIVFRSLSLSIYVEYVTQHLDTLEPVFIDRILALSDPTSPFVRSVARIAIKTSDDLENDESQTSFSFQKLMELFLFALLVKLKGEEMIYCRELLLPLQEHDNASLASDIDSFGSRDNLSEQIWPIRKDIMGQDDDRNKRRVETVLSSGYAHTALIRNGSVYTWGQTTKGCLGHGPTMSRYASPLPITWLSCLKLEVTSVACGKYHTLALTNNGVYSWGCSTYGQLGLGEVHESPHPRLISALANENVVSIKCGQYHSLALTGQGSLFAWGWGVHGQLGLGNVEDERIPKYVHTLKDYVIIDMAGGHGHTIALTSKGHVYSFGSSVFGQLGTGTSAKRSMPVLVKGINGRVTNIATGYFHNLALTESNTLYTWGTSPQSLRLQAQAYKRSRMLQNQNNSAATTGEPEQKSESTQQQDEGCDSGPERTDSDAHLFPTIVDTRNVNGRIVQLSCGCHHSALVSESGILYTWGRSLDGQLGNGGQREVVIPTALPNNTFKVDEISCGSEFTTAQERQTGKIYSWGSNSLGQLGVPVKDSATKSLDGRLIVLKSCKRVVRIPHTGSNSFDTPKEIGDIPASSFTYRNLTRHNATNNISLSSFDNGSYNHQALHYVIEKYFHSLSTSSLLKKCLEYNNYQAASKIALLQNETNQSLIYQFKALQNVPKYRTKSADKPEGIKDGTKTPKSELMTPDSEIHLFTVQGGQEEMCEESQSQDVSNSDDDILERNGAKTDDLLDEDDPKNDLEMENDLNLLKTEYIEDAKFILDSYLKLNPDSNTLPVLETGIHFWVAEKLPTTSLENFFLDRIDNLCIDLGFILCCQPRKKHLRPPTSKLFSSSFFLTMTSKVLSYIEKDGSCFEYLETMSRIIDDNSNSEMKRNTTAGKAKNQKSETYVKEITEKLKKQCTNENFVNISYREVISECVYLFSCGHSLQNLRGETEIFKELDDGELSRKLVKLYDSLDVTGRVDAACPSCVYNYLKQ